MIIKCAYVGKIKEVVSKKDGKHYDVHLFSNDSRSFEVLTEHNGFKPNASGDYYINSYKGKDGFWKTSLVKFI